jgi:hypothetical protein
MDEATSKPVVTSDPFGTPSPPWYRRREDGAPYGYARALAFGTGLIGLLAQGHVHGLVDKTAFVLFVLGGPVWALDAWWRGRRRRRSEELLPGWLSAPPPGSGGR